MLVLVLGFCLSAETRENQGLFRFSFHIKGHVEGRFLFIFPYRVVLEIGGSARFSVRSKAGEAGRFELIDMDAPGYLLRTLGLKGRRVAIFAVGRNPHELLRFIEEKIMDFSREYPVLSGGVQRYCKYPLEFRKGLQGLIGFWRDRGAHRVSCRPLNPVPLYDARQVEAEFGVYRIMCEFLRGFNRPLVSDDPRGWPREWVSGGWDFSPRLNAVAWTISPFLKKFIRFRQKKTLSLTFRRTISRDAFLEYCGEARPDMQVWGRFEIQKVRRVVRCRRSNGELLLDMLVLEMGDRRGRGGSATATLERIDGGGSGLDLSFRMDCPDQRTPAP